MATLLPADSGRASETVRPANGHTFSLAELQGYVGGTIELIHLSDGQVLVRFEEAKMQNEPKNERASEMAGYGSAGEMRAYLAELAARCAPHGEPVLLGDPLPDDDDAPADFIAGDVLLCEAGEIRQEVCCDVD